MLDAVATEFQAVFVASDSAAGVGRLGLAFFAGDFFVLAGAGRVFACLTLDCVFLAAGFGFWAFAFLSLSQRAFAAALIFALARAFTAAPNNHGGK